MHHELFKSILNVKKSFNSEHLSSFNYNECFNSNLMIKKAMKNNNVAVFIYFLNKNNKY